MSEKTPRFTLGINLDNYRYDARHCTGQAQCRWIDYNYVPGVDFSWRCPSWQEEGFDSFGAEGKCNIVYYLLTGKLDYSSPMLREVAYKCPLCGSCDVACKRNLDYEIQMMLESLRARLVEKGYGPMPQHQEMTNNIVSSHNRFGKNQSERLKWLPRGITPAKKADILYFVGCRASFANTEISEATARIFRAAGVPFTVLREEQCCGHFLYTTGQTEKAREIAEENLKSIQKTGAGTLVTSCAECYKTIKVDYPKLLGQSTSDLGFNVVHVVELVDSWVKKGTLKLNNRVDIKVTYHDPCNLGRLSEPWYHWKGVRKDWGVFDPPRTVRRGVHGIYQPPRDILKAITGLELVEMVRRRENAWCSGNDAGVKEAFPEFALWTGRERLREAATTGAAAIVSCCPGCKENFADAAKNGMKAYDIVELVVKAIGK